jgi:hypothetical protein
MELSPHSGLRTGLLDVALLGTLRHVCTLHAHNRYGNVKDAA